MDENGTSNGSSGDLPDDTQRWTAKRRAALVMSILTGETTVAEAVISAIRFGEVVGLSVTLCCV